MQTFDFRILFQKFNLIGIMIVATAVLSDFYSLLGL